MTITLDSVHGMELALDQQPSGARLGLYHVRNEPLFCPCMPIRGDLGKIPKHWLQLNAAASLICCIAFLIGLQAAEYWDCSQLIAISLITT